MDKYLYHGTALRFIPNIVARGIHPRSGTAGNWAGTVRSNRKAVYLTNTYPFHFAQNAVDIKNPNDAVAILEIEVDALEPERLHADEDAIEQALRGHDELPADWSLKRRTIYYRARAHHWPADKSLQALGTCAHQGPIPASAVRRVAIIEQDKVIELVVAGGIDPIIHINNFLVMGEKYTRFVRWLFDGTGPLIDPNEARFAALGVISHNPGVDREGITIYSLADANIAAAAVGRRPKGAKDGQR